MAIEDVKKVYSLFLDEGRSEQILNEYQDQYLYDAKKSSSKFFSCFNVENDRFCSSYPKVLRISLLIFTLSFTVDKGAGGEPMEA